MKKIIFGLVVMVLAGMAFAEEGVHPEIQRYVKSTEGATDIEVLYAYPCGEETVKLLEDIRLGKKTDSIVAEWVVKSPVPISSPLIEVHKAQARVALTAQADAYVRGEAYTVLYGDENAAKIATEVGASNVFAQTLKNNREILRISYAYKSADGSPGYGVVFFLAIDKEPLDREIQARAEAISSGNYQPEKRVEPTERKTAGASKPSSPVSSASDNEKVVESVRALMASDERIQRYRAENAQAFGWFSAEE